MLNNQDICFIWLKLWHNTHFDSKNILKKLNFRIFNFRLHKEKIQVFPDFGLKICSYFKLVGFQDIHTWHISANFHSCTAFSTYGPFGIAYLPKIMIFWSKPLQIEYALKSRMHLSFLSNFHTNTHITNTNMKKNKISKNFRFWPPSKKSRFLDFTNFRPKFPD